MPIASLTTTAIPVAAPLTDVLAHPTADLAKQVYTDGMCTKANLTTDDPWFPVSKVHVKLEAQAREACHGCPVIAECLEMTLRLESDLPETRIAGTFGAKAAHERIALIHARRTAGGAR